MDDPTPPTRTISGVRLVGLLTALFLAVAAFSAVLVIDLRTPEAGPVERPGPCVQNGRFTFNTSPCVYNPRTDTCPDYNLMNYANACFIVVPEGRP
jgi:hypothetical protein